MRRHILIAALIIFVLALGMVDLIQDRLYKRLDENYIEYQKSAEVVDSLRLEQIKVLLQLLECCKDSTLTVPSEPLITPKGERI